LFSPCPTQISSISRDGKRPTVDSPIEFYSNFPTRTFRRLAFVKVDKRLDYADIHRRFKFNEFVFLSWGSAMVAIIIALWRPIMLEK
jgi:hypothetical protein